MQEGIRARDDQREVNNLPKLHEDQEQGRMLVIDEAKAARELVAVAKLLTMWDEQHSELCYSKLEVDNRIVKIRQSLLDIQDFVFRHRGTSNPEVTGREVEDLKVKVQRALDLT